MIFLWAVGYLRKVDRDRTIDKAFKRQTELLGHSQRIEELRAHRETTRLAIVQLQKTIKEQKPVTGPSVSFNDQLVLDAMARESRAKAALAAVLRENGTPQAAIDDIMNTIDSPEQLL